MIAKIVQGSGFRGVVNYVLGKEEARLLYGEGVRLKDKASIIGSFITQSRMKPDVVKPVAHISLSFSPEDKNRLTDAGMVGIAKEYLDAMGYRDTQYIIVRHDDRAHPHVHLVVNRIGNDGKRISDKNEKLRSRSLCLELTKKSGLHIGQGKENVNRHRLREPDKTKYEIYDALKAAIPKCRNWDELRSALERQRIAVEFRKNGSTDKVQGIRFEKNGYPFNGSKVDRSCSFSKIDWQLRQNNWQQEQAIKQEQSAHPEQSSTVEALATSIGGLFDIQPSNTNDAQEQADYWLYRKKKKKPRRGLHL
jgi:hypothetical protein